MFYSKEILTRKNGGFGIIWLAATLGSRSNLRKLSKKEVNSVNLVKACEYITTPPEPLALRLTSNLMIGITRVYHQQYQFYYTDVNGVWHNLQKALIEMRGESVDMTVPQARFEAITLKDDPFFEIELNIPMHNIIMPQNADNQMGFTQFFSSDQETFGSNKSRQSLITLPEIDAEFTASSGGFSNVDGFLDDDILMIDDSDIRIDFDAEGCLHEFIAQQGGQQDTTTDQQQMENMNMEAMNDIIRRVRDEHEAGLEERRANKRRKRNDEEEMEIVNDQFMDVNPEIEVEEMPQQIPAEEQDNANKENIPDRQPRRNRRKIRVMFDEETELTNEQILEMRQKVVDDLNESEIVAREKMRMQEGKRQLDNILYTPGKPFLAPQLASLWEQHCAPMLYDENVKRRRIQPLTSDDNIDVGSPLIHGVRDSSVKSDEPERLRKEGSQQSSIIISGMESSGFDKYPEIDHFSDQNSVGGSADVNIDLLGQLRSGGRRRLDSMGFNMPSIDFSDDRILDCDSINLPIFGDLPLFDSSSQARVGLTATVVNSEQEAMNFFESIKTIMNDAYVSIATFQDIMETQHVRRASVARDFYYVLALANKNLIKVNQSQAYGNIMIQVQNE